VAVNDYVRMKFALFAQRDMFAYNAIRANFAARANLGFWVDNRCAMNHEMLPFPRG